ncbi:hypothetical protein niasHT_013058 [Heterodera trifolii]|uniref:Uncharacterized protein n=1 Tax=Heterodera trifolii TaxID=157864 RepID=A0ABD2LEG0_9BILA
MQTPIQIAFCFLLILFLQNVDSKISLGAVVSTLNAKQRNQILKEQIHWHHMSKQQTVKALKKQPDFMFHFYLRNGNPTKIFRRNPFCTFTLLPKHYCYEK